MISTQNVVNFLLTYFALFVLCNERYVYKKDCSSSTLSFASQTTKTEPIKSLQHFSLIVKFYTKVISTQNVENFERHILPLLSFPVKDWLANDINELELSFLVIISFIRKDK